MTKFARNPQDQVPNGCQGRPPISAFGFGISREEGFNLSETMVAVAALALVIITLYTGLAYGFSVARLNSENLRATQILTEKMEIIRLCNWNQITKSNGFIPQTFTAPFYISGGVTNGPIYQGRITLTKPQLTESYSNDLRQITVAVTWTNSNVARQRSMSTFVSPYGIQTYTY